MIEMIEIKGEKYKIMGWYKENGFTNFLILKEGNIKPHLLMTCGDKCKLFGPLGNSLPGTYIDLGPVLKQLNKHLINNKEFNYESSNF